MAITEHEIDPSIAGNSGTGTHGDPYGDVQYALDTVTRDTTNGDRFNIWNTSDEVLAAALTLTSYTSSGNPTRDAPLWFQGMTSTGSPGDGGVGGISGNATYSVMYLSSMDYVHWRDLHLHNTGSAWVLRMGAYCSVISCEIDNSSQYGLYAGLGLVAVGNHIHNIGTYGLTGTSNYQHFAHNLFENDGANEMTRAINCGTATTVMRNLFNLDGATDAIVMGHQCACLHNSIFSASGTGSGIVAGAFNNLKIINNAIEGFSGTGGIGFDCNASADIELWGGNAAYNNATNYSLPTVIINNDLGDNETLSASPFNSPSTNDFAPNDTGSIKEGARPQAFYV